MKVVIIDEITGVSVYKSWAAMKKVHSFEKDDFTEVSGDYILNTTGDTFEISKDIKLLERVATDRVFAKSKMSGVDVISIIGMAFAVLVYFKLGSLPEEFMTVINAAKEGVTQ